MFIINKLFRLLLFLYRFIIYINFTTKIILIINICNYFKYFYLYFIFKLNIIYI